MANLLAGVPHRVWGYQHSFPLQLSWWPVALAGEVFSTLYLGERSCLCIDSPLWILSCHCVIEMQRLVKPLTFIHTVPWFLEHCCSFGRNESHIGYHSHRKRLHNLILFWSIPDRLQWSELMKAQTGQSFPSGLVLLSTYHSWAYLHSSSSRL